MKHTENEYQKGRREAIDDMARSVNEIWTRARKGANWNDAVVGETLQEVVRKIVEMRG